jgi:hypothetical protein
MASEIKVDTIVNAGGDNDTGIDLATNDNIKFNIAGSQKAIIDSSGNLMGGGMTSADLTSQGFRLGDTGFLYVSAANDSNTAIFNRRNSDGEVIRIVKDNSTVGQINTEGGDLAIGTGDVGLQFLDGAEVIAPFNLSTNSRKDNSIDLGGASERFDDIFATNSTIQTSDQNEKQDIASATTKELNVAKKLSALFKTFRWKDKVAEKGDKARTHTGIIAQEIQSAFSAEGLDASNYGLFTSDTWTNDDGKEQTRLGVRYPELFSFIFSSIEARLTALESK